MQQVVWGLDYLRLSIDKPNEQGEHGVWSDNTVQENPEQGVPLEVVTSALFYAHASSDGYCQCFCHRQPCGCRDPSGNDGDWPETSTWPPEWQEIKGWYICDLSILTNDHQLKQISKTNSTLSILCKYSYQAATTFIHWSIDSKKSLPYNL